MLIGDNIKLRRIERADLWQLWKWHEERELYLFNRINPLISYEVLSERFPELLGFRKDFIVETKEDRPLGICSYQDIMWKNRSCGLAFKINEDDAQQSFAVDVLETMLSFLFAELNMFRVHAFVPEYSLHEISALKKTGFTCEGRLREHIFLDGNYKDVLVYAIFKNEFPLHQSEEANHDPGKDRKFEKNEVN